MSLDGWGIAGVVIASAVVVACVGYLGYKMYDRVYGRKVNLSSDGLIHGMG